MVDKDNSTEDKGQAQVPISPAAQRLLKFNIPIEQVKAAFFDIYPVIYHLEIEALVSNHTGWSDAEVIAVYLVGLMTGNSFEGCRDVFSAWEKAAAFHGWFTREVVQGE